MKNTAIGTLLTMMAFQSPGEIVQSRPRYYPSKKKEKTQADFDRMIKAEEKRQRRLERNIRNQRSE